jgi:hypothetical protein
VSACALLVTLKMRPFPPAATMVALAWKVCSSPGRELVRDHAAAGAVDHDQVEHVELVEERDLVLDRLLVERLQDHVAGAVGRVAGALDGALAELARVAAELALGDLALRRAAERQAHVLELVDGLDHLDGERLRHVLVGQVVTALDRVEGVPLRVVFGHVAQSRADAALRRTRVRARRVELADDGDPHVRVLRRVPRGHEPGAPRADHDHVEPVCSLRHPSLFPSHSVPSARTASPISSKEKVHSVMTPSTKTIPATVKSTIFHTKRRPGRFT